MANKSRPRLNSSDDASQHEQEMRDDGIAEARRKQEAKVFQPIGLCYNCFTQVGEEVLYCDDECKADHIHRLTIIERTHAR